MPIVSFEYDRWWASCVVFTADNGVALASTRDARKLGILDVESESLFIIRDSPANRSAE